MKKSIYSRDYETAGESFKFKLPCNNLKDTPEWLHVKGYLTRKEFNILIGSLKNYKDIIIKFGPLSEIEKEYNFSKLAYDNGVSNFIKFLCYFTCNDSEVSIRNRDFLKDPTICKSDGDIGCIIMPYYSQGSIDSYRWDRSNFSTLKNVIHQCIFALLYAFEKFNFIHGDLHLANVLLRRSKKSKVMYEKHIVPVMGLYPIIMDFGKSYRSESVKELYLCIKKFLGLIESISNAVIAINCDEIRCVLTKYIDESKEVDDIVYNTLLEKIDTIRIIHEYKRQVKGIDSL